MKLSNLNLEKHYIVELLFVSECNYFFRILKFNCYLLIKQKITIVDKCMLVEVTVKT